MPNGIFPVPTIQPNPGRSVRTRPSRTALRQLPSQEERSRLANRLVTLLGDARRSSLGPFRKKTRARHAAIRHSTDDLMALVLRLRDGEPITARGAAMTALLVDRKTSPLRRGEGRDLQYAIRAARVALDGPDGDVSDLAA